MDITGGNVRNSGYGEFCWILTNFINYTNNFDVDKEKLFSNIVEIFENCDK